MTIKDESPLAVPSARPTPVRGRLFYLALAYLCVGLGMVGAVLPLLPTTPFLLVALWAYFRSHPEKAQKLLEHPRFGPALRDWREQGAIPTRAKIAAVGVMALSWVIVYLTAPHPAAPIVVGVILCCTGTFVATRPSPKPRQARDLAAPEGPAA
ncbi:YbaN family protein [Niveispirillum sp. SYP-B3756]|uniref:YbaN family protein n=1 Tax=Niveispirillum sp. SYP-B3756 TaxID=2662178 RepID=UPI001FFEE96F|nr:YbaN family protein [Niveispirillum sp. SYP-B3756]